MGDLQVGVSPRRYPVYWFEDRPRVSALSLSGKKKIKEGGLLREMFKCTVPSMVYLSFTGLWDILWYFARSPCVKDTLHMRRHRQNKLLEPQTNRARMTTNAQWCIKMKIRHLCMSVMYTELCTFRCFYPAHLSCLTTASGNQCKGAFLNVRCVYVNTLCSCCLYLWRFSESLQMWMKRSSTTGNHEGHCSQ